MGASGGGAAGEASAVSASSSRRVAARSFSNAAEIYETSRPGYPEAAVDWMIPTGASSVLDLGAGTGKLTSALVARGLDVLAIDPSAEMLSVLTRVVPEARTIVGEAEALPLRDGSVDLVTAAQAWHWVDPDRAGAEAARILAPGGRLSLVWNIRDERLDWLRRLGEIAGSERSYRDLGEDPVVSPHFGPFERARFEWSHLLTLEEVLDLVRSRSWYLTADEAGRERMIVGVSELVAASAVDGRVEMAYVTEVFRAHRR
ncbi:class I SAM-dependent methyltransferase [Labedella phragmitis]|uniref:Class I SAM-dependent methyltransferase n=2 Tax=Labedella phragmitis TaxID=2498849 RepID=A0A444PR99_9MICO|nr:class I SAM-dependent methyltransferase [Labedella phragmitis]